MSETKHRNRLPFAEDTNYWKTSQSSADSWMDKTIKLIRDFGGRVTAEAFGSEPVSGRSAFMLAFEMQGDQFKIIWPVLPSRARGGERAAKIQAATLVYHDVKARLLSIKIFGARAVFFNYLQLPDGRNATEASYSELSMGLPALFGAYQLSSGDDEIIEGEIS